MLYKGLIKGVTGAFNHSVNDLILFADNTYKLTEIKQDLLNDTYKSLEDIISHIKGYLYFCQESYMQQIKDNKHIKNMNKIEENEFIQLHVSEYLKQFERII